MQLLLDNKEVLNLGEDLRGLRIFCRQGCGWVTQAGDSRDLLLHAGQELRIARRGRVLLTATESSRLELIGAPQSGPIMSWWRRLRK